MKISKYYFVYSYYILGSDILSKLSNIFHNNIKYSTNNKNTYIASNKDDKRVVNNSLFNPDDLINYFNKRIVIELNNGTKKEGILLSKRNNILLLDTGDYISINDILSIK